MLFLYKGKQMGISIDFDDENPRSGVAVMIWVFQNVQNITTFYMKHHCLKR